MIKAVEIAQVSNVPYRVIDIGSNLLALDTGFSGMIIKLGKGLEQVQFAGSDIHVGAGHSIVSLASLAGRSDLTGLEFAAGIPGSIGGEGGCLYECWCPWFRYVENHPKSPCTVP